MRDRVLVLLLLGPSIAGCIPDKRVTGTGGDEGQDAADRSSADGRSDHAGTDVRDDSDSAVVEADELLVPDVHDAEAEDRASPDENRGEELPDLGIDLAEVSDQVASEAENLEPETGADHTGSETTGTEAEELPDLAPMDADAHDQPDEAPDASADDESSGPACGDGKCEEESGESCDTCAPDCGPCAACGDGDCQVQAGETCETCFLDCGACGACGDGKCLAGEAPSAEAAQPGENPCPGDCGPCGDGTCSKWELEAQNYCAKDCAPSVCGNCDCEPTESATPGAVGFCPADCFTCMDGICSCEELINPLYADCKLADCVQSCGDAECGPGESVDTCPLDCPKCGDGECGTAEADKGTCPQDCVAPCGDGKCQGGETQFNCPVDCGWCGDGVCGLVELAGGYCTKKDCPQTCGDGSCLEFETADSCQKDCGCQPWCDPSWECGPDEGAGGGFSCGQQCGACPPDLVCEEHSCVKPEICNGEDDDGDKAIDEGGPALCSLPPNVDQVQCDGECTIAACKWDYWFDKYHDLNGQYADGCECLGDTMIASLCDPTCEGGSPMWMDGQILEDKPSGNVVPKGDYDWLMMGVADGVLDPDECVTGKFEAELMQNPADAFRFDAYLVADPLACNPATPASCTAVTYCEIPIPCDTASKELKVKVYRKSGAEVTCDKYEVALRLLPM